MKIIAGLKIKDMNVWWFLLLVQRIVVVVVNIFYHYKEPYMGSSNSEISRSIPTKNWSQINTDLFQNSLTH